MMASSPVRAVCALLFFLGCTAATDVAGPARTLAQTTVATARPDTWWTFPGGGQGAACYFWDGPNAPFRPDWKLTRFCQNGLVCCPRQPSDFTTFPKSSGQAETANFFGWRTNKFGRYTLGNCRTSCTPSTEYCCAGPGKCRIPVPRPPTFEELPPAPRPVRRNVAAEVNATAVDINNNQEAGVSTSTVDPANICTAPSGTRVTAPFGTPRTDGQAKILRTATFTWPPPNTGGCLKQDGTPFASPCGQRDCSFLGACSGNTISSGLVLFAAHCVDPTDFRSDILQGLRRTAGYPTNADPCRIASMPITYTSIVACYNYDNTGGVSDLNRCRPEDTYVANGFSWFTRTPQNQQDGSFDLAVLFLSRPRILTSYYQYNYRENYDPTTPVNVENWSYIGPDCVNCNVQCLLSHVGPATGPGNNLLGTGTAAFQTAITSTPGNSGSCVLNAADGCCIGVSSFSRNSNAGTCGTECTNFYSPITSGRPISTLWAARMKTLPNARF